MRDGADSTRDHPPTPAHEEKLTEAMQPPCEHLHAHEVSGADAAGSRALNLPPAPPTCPTARKLGPLVVIRRLERPVLGRLYAAGVATAAWAVVGVALSLTPDPGGMGTHRQLSIYPFPCGFVSMTGFPCPTCGMTTSFAYTMRGRVFAAMGAQFAGFVLAMGTILTALVASAAVVSGRYPAPNWYRVDGARLVWLMLVLFVVGWAAKIGMGLLDGSLPAR